MEETNTPNMGPAVSFMFYIFYLFYFMTYSYEIIFIISKKADYFIFCILLFTTMFSIFFSSLILLFISFFLIVIVSLSEIYGYTHIVFKYMPDDEFNNLFLLVRLFAAVNFLIFFCAYLRILRRRRENWNRLRSQNNMSQTQNENYSANNFSRHLSGCINNNIQNENRIPVNHENTCRGHTMAPYGHTRTPVPNHLIPIEKDILYSEPNIYNPQYVPSTHYNIETPYNINTIGNNQAINEYKTLNHSLSSPNNPYEGTLNTSFHLSLYKNDDSTQHKIPCLIKEEFNIGNNFDDNLNNMIPRFTANNNISENMPYMNKGSIKKK